MDHGCQRKVANCRFSQTVIEQGIRKYSMNTIVTGRVWSCIVKWKCSIGKCLLYDHLGFSSIEQAIVHQCSIFP